MMRYFYVFVFVIINVAQVDACKAFIDSRWFQDRKFKFSIHGASAACRSQFYAAKPAFAPTNNRNLCSPDSKLATDINRAGLNTDNLFVIWWYCLYQCKQKCPGDNYRQIECYTPQLGSKEADPSHVYVQCLCNACTAGNDNLVTIDRLYDEHCILNGGTSWDLGSGTTQPSLTVGISHLWETPYWMSKRDQWLYPNGLPNCKKAISDYSNAGVIFVGQACAQETVGAHITNHFCYLKCWQQQQKMANQAKVDTIACHGLSGSDPNKAELRCQCFLRSQPVGNQIWSQDTVDQWMQVVADWNSGCTSYFAQ